ETDGAESVEDERADVSGLEAVDPQDLPARLHQLVDLVLPGDVVGERRAAQTVDVIAQAEDGGSLRRLIGTYAFEDGGPVVEGVGEEMDLGLFPGNQFTVHPDGGGFLHTDIVPRSATPGFIRSGTDPHPRGDSHRSSHSRMISNRSS